jgi:hypothetical protein
MNIERTEFTAWMEKIMERFDILKEQVASSQSRFVEIDGELPLDNQDILQLLKISSRSLQRYRTDKSCFIIPLVTNLITSCRMSTSSFGNVLRQELFL